VTNGDERRKATTEAEDFSHHSRVSKKGLSQNAGGKSPVKKGRGGKNKNDTVTQTPRGPKKKKETN